MSSINVTNCEYYLGLTMDTQSVGWAVTDPTYRLLKAKGYDTWGIRSFDEAELSKDRRTKRAARRRHQREQVRIGLLKSYFDEAIRAVDPDFYERLDSSKYLATDKKVSGHYSLFNDINYNDADYYRAYPTIFHLRNELAHSTDPHDVRLVFLAILNMFKSRGHFLTADLDDESGKIPVKKLYESFVSQVADVAGLSFPSGISENDLMDILSSTDHSRTEKAELLSNRLDITKKGAQNKQKVLFLRALCGLKVDAKNLFIESDVDTDVNTAFSFAEASYEEKFEEFTSIFSEEQCGILETMKLIYDAGLLYGILKDFDCISEARVHQYDKHREDLHCLKKAYRDHKTLKDYDAMFRLREVESEKNPKESFRIVENGSYSAYVRSALENGEHHRREAHQRSIDDLYKTIKKDLGDIKGCANVNYILSEIKNENFLLLQRSSENRVIPNQVYRKEMSMILKNAEAYLPFLCVKDELGLTVTEKLLELFSFRVPYYVGPVSTNSQQSGGNGWVVRREDGDVLPWNMAQKIDLKATSEAFISRMVRDCTYMAGEQVLPKESMLYQSFCVLNEINSIQLNGVRLSVEIKQEVFDTLFKKGKVVSKKAIEKFLAAKGLWDESSQLSGMGDKTTSSLSSYGKFYAILGDRIDEDPYKKAVEKIIFWGTVYGESRKLLRERIVENYSDLFSDAEIKRISGLRFKDWGRLSKEFLTLEGCDKSTGEIFSLIRALWETRMNHMELLHDDDYTFGEALVGKELALEKTVYDFAFADLDDFYFSAPVKRMVWQTIQVVRDIHKIMGHAPARIFIKMSGTEAAIQNEKSYRAKNLVAKYDNKQIGKSWKAAIEDAASKDLLKRKKVYLYFTQKGRCMYSGDVIDFEALLQDSESYDIDHIYPKHFTNDDNLETNLVLVKKSINKEKGDRYPIAESIRNDQKAMWSELRRLELISEEKFNRLTRTTPFTPEELAGFIDKQLVQTGYGQKSVASLLKKLFETESTVIYTKSSAVSDFRHRFDIPRCPELNPFHISQDAYLSIIVGNCYYVRFTKSPLHFIKNEYLIDPKKHAYHLANLFNKDILRGDDVAWIAASGDLSGSISRVKKMVSRNTPRYTRMTISGHGAFANETLYGKTVAKEGVYIPTKTSDPRLVDVTKYGGFTNLYTSHFILVEHTNRKKRILTLEAVPIYYKPQLEKSSDGALWFCKEILRLTDPVVKLERIDLQSLFKIDGFYMHLTGMHGSQLSFRNAVSLCLNEDWQFYIRGLRKSLTEDQVTPDITKEKNLRLYDEMILKHSETIFKNKPAPMSRKLQDSRETFISLSTLKQCEVLLEILNLTKVGRTSANLKLLGLSAVSGIIQPVKKISSFSECKLIHQSPTGLYEKTIDLLNL